MHVQSNRSRRQSTAPVGRKGPHQGVCRVILVAHHQHCKVAFRAGDPDPLSWMISARSSATNPQKPAEAGSARMRRQAKVPPGNADR